MTLKLQHNANINRPVWGDFALREGYGGIGIEGTAV